MTKMTIKVHEASHPSANLKSELAYAVREFHKFIGEPQGSDRYTGTVATYITDLGYNSTESDKQEALDVIEHVRNVLLELRGLIEDTPITTRD